MKTKTIRQTITLPASPTEVYGLLFDSKVLSRLHHGKTTMNKKPNGKFTVFNGYCHGYNITLLENKSIEQAWNFAEDGWPADHFSICRFGLKKDGKKTRLTFTQTGVPEANYESLRQGWHDYYWKPMKEYLINNK